MLRDRDEAADVLHDTFLVAGARLHHLRDPAKLRPWLFAIARHETLRRITQVRVLGVHRHYRDNVIVYATAVALAA